MKICTGCGKEKDESSFSKASKGKNGLSARCKDCRNQYYQDNKVKILAQCKMYRESHKEEKSLRDRKYFERNREKILVRCRNNKEERRKADKKYRENHSDKRRARGQSRYQIDKGNIVRQPCEKCGQPNAHAHHEDYLKPMDIIWLCQKHHMRHHAHYKEID